MDFDPKEAERLVETYADLILRLSYSRLGHRQDAEDICQTVFLRLLERAPDFASPDHEKAWIIRTTRNACKDLLKSRWRRSRVGLEEVPPLTSPPPQADPVLEALGQLPAVYREVLYLHYYEGYQGKEIARLLRRPAATVYTQLRRGRAALQALLEREELP
jgi:RNA polymerase sigma-70 factor (ECF subfamily)